MYSIDVAVRERLFQPSAATHLFQSRKYTHISHISRRAHFPNTAGVVRSVCKCGVCRGIQPFRNDGDCLHDTPGDWYGVLGIRTTHLRY